MRGIVDQIEARGARLVVIGNGTPSQALAFRAEQRLTFPLLTDPSRRTHRLLGFRRGLLATLALAAIRRGLTAFCLGFRQSRTQGDPFQQGGAVIVGVDGRLLLRQVSRSAGDHVAPAALLAALVRASG